MKMGGEHLGWNGYSASVGTGAFLTVSGLLNHQQGQRYHVDLDLQPHDGEKSIGELKVSRFERSTEVQENNWLLIHSRL